MSAAEPLQNSSVQLVDALDHLLNRGAVLAGEATLSLAGVDLVYVGLNLVVASVQTLEERLTSAPRLAASAARRNPQPLAQSGRIPRRPEGQPDVYQSAGEVAEDEPRAESLGEQSHPERGLAQLVLTLVDLLRQLVERQAVRRMEADALQEEQVERMGLALRDLGATMRDLCASFGLRQEDLGLDLGPLRPLLEDAR